MLLKPDFNVETLFDINFELLKAEGIKVIIFDLDSTLMASKSGAFTPNIITFLSELKKDFTLIIASNNKNKQYIAQTQQLVDFKVIGNANKPSPKIIANYLSSINASPNQAVIIGDRPLTDILAGKFLGSKTVLVDSITKDIEPKLTRFVRFLERLSVS